jgi:hypothetical protein
MQRPVISPVRVFSSIKPGFKPGFFTTENEGLLFFAVVGELAIAQPVFPQLIGNCRM